MPRSKMAVLLAAAISLLWCASIGEAAGAYTGLAEVLDDLPVDRIESGILHDRVVPLAPIAGMNGAVHAAAVSISEWIQACSEMRRAAVREIDLPSREAIDRMARAGRSEGVVPIVIVDFLYERIRPDAWENGALQVDGGKIELGSGEPFETRRLVAAVPLQESTVRGEHVVFRIDAGAHWTNDPRGRAAIEIDFDDGRGYRPAPPGMDMVVHYRDRGERTIRFRLLRSDGTMLHAGARFDVRALRIPTPDDTLRVTASIPYQGQYGTGDAYVYLADAHEAIVEPVIVIEGFDYDNTMNWDELYTLLNREGLLEELRSRGFDAVVLNFDDAVDHIQRNAFVAVELIEEIQSRIGPERTLIVTGASMGGLIGRYALAYMEDAGRPHQVRTFLSFDSPQNGANIPLGVQYWVQFFAGESEEAAALLAALNSPAARQMLLYHTTDPPGATGAPDPLRTQLLADLAAVGDYPALPRKAAIANGSGTAWGIGFPPGAQIISWEYESFLIDIIGNVWAVPDGSSHRIFHGLIDVILLPPDEQIVTVAGTRPYDNAPGGWRDSMAQMDAAAAPYGDIIALHPNHSFIPTISALGIEITDPFYDIDADPDILALTAFDAIYYPPRDENQEHVLITAENAGWILEECILAANDAPESPPGVRAEARIASISPNPAAERIRIEYLVPAEGQVRLSVHDAEGRRIRLLREGWVPAGPNSFEWFPTDERGRRLAGGIYLLCLSGDGWAASRKMVIH